MYGYINIVLMAHHYQYAHRSLLPYYPLGKKFYVHVGTGIVSPSRSHAGMTHAWLGVAELFTANNYATWSLQRATCPLSLSSHVATEQASGSP